MRKDEGELLAVRPSGPPLRGPSSYLIDRPRTDEPTPQSSGVEASKRHTERPRNGRLEQVIGIPQQHTTSILSDLLMAMDLLSEIASHCRKSLAEHGRQVAGAS